MLGLLSHSFPFVPKKLGLAFADVCSFGTLHMKCLILWIQIVTIQDTLLATLTCVVSHHNTPCRKQPLLGGFFGILPAPLAL